MAYIITLLIKENGIEKTATEKDMLSYLKVLDIMSKIYNENPSYWPYGLNIPGHDSVYLIKDASNDLPIGFVGWQEHQEVGKTIGSYSIGILPEYRGKGFAKEAVAKVIREKAANVDIVYSYVKPDNTSSLKLANSLNVPVITSF